MKVVIKWKIGFETGPASGSNMWVEMNWALLVHILTMTGLSHWQPNLVRSSTSIPGLKWGGHPVLQAVIICPGSLHLWMWPFLRSEEHTSELQSRGHLVCRRLLEKKKR